MLTIYILIALVTAILSYIAMMILCVDKSESILDCLTIYLFLALGLGILWFITIPIAIVGFIVE
jgi:hypothetical protein